MQRTAPEPFCLYDLLAQGGGKAATIGPLDANCDHYEARLANLLGEGKDLGAVHCALSGKIAQALVFAEYSSWRFHQMPVSLRPFGARSSH
jgi:hypothetical protein